MGARRRVFEESLMKTLNLASLLPTLLLTAVVGAAVPKPLDPLQVAPHIYELAFENEKVRMLRQTVRVGETQLVHEHPDRVIVYLQSCAWLEDDGAGGERMQSFKIGEAVWAPAETHGGRSINVVQECQILEIELL